MRTLVLLVAAVLLVGCPVPRPPEPDYVVTDLDAGPDPLEDASSPCSAACAAMRSLGCPEGVGLPDAGVTCYRACQVAGDHFDPSCAARARTRAAMASCNVRCVR